MCEHVWPDYLQHCSLKAALTALKLLLYVTYKYILYHSPTLKTGNIVPRSIRAELLLQTHSLKVNVQSPKKIYSLSGSLKENQKLERRY